MRCLVQTHDKKLAGLTGMTQKVYLSLPPAYEGPQKIGVIISRLRAAGTCNAAHRNITRALSWLEERGLVKSEKIGSVVHYIKTDDKQKPVAPSQTKVAAAVSCALDEGVDPSSPLVFEPTDFAELAGVSGLSSASSFDQALEGVSALAQTLRHCTNLLTALASVMDEGLSEIETELVRLSESHDREVLTGDKLAALEDAVANLRR